jgi:hypothetical protein
MKLLTLNGPTILPHGDSYFFLMLEYIFRFPRTLLLVDLEAVVQPQ